MSEEVTETKVAKLPKDPQDHKRGKKNPVIKTVWICNDTEMADELEELTEALNRAKYQADNMIDGPNREEARAKVDELTPKVEDLKIAVRANSVRFKFRGIGRNRFEKILTDFPLRPETAKKISEAGGNPDHQTFDPEDIVIPILNASVIEPEGYNFEGIHDDEDWNEAEITALWEAAYSAQQTRRVISLGKG